MDTIEILKDDLARHLDEIRSMFKRGVKVTLVIRHPGLEKKNMDAGMVIGNDDLDAVIAEIKRRQAANKNTNGAN